jgi:predicted RNA binding protein YcfA (HicA-like mRNA interferase family)
MGKNLHNIKGQDAIKAFLRFGGIEKKGKGDHVNIKMPNGMIVTIPVNKELKIGLIKNAIRKSGLTDEQFYELLQ